MHNIAFIRTKGGKDKACLAWYGERPWHGLGQEVIAAMTAEQAMREAGLNWRVDLAPVFYGCDHRAYGERRAVVRQDTGQALGIVGDRYVPVQNDEVFAFMDSLVEGGELRYHVAGALGDGRKVFALAKVHSDPLSVVPGDIIDGYLLAAAAHDGSGSLLVLPTAVRTVCENTLNLALANARRKRSAVVRIRHSGDVASKRDLARRILGMAQERLTAFQEAARQLARVPMGPDAFRQFTLQLVPDASSEQGERAQQRVSVMRQVLQDQFTSGPGSDIVGARNTAWGALNAVTAYTTHVHGPATSAQTRFMTTYFGAGDDLNQRALVMLRQAT